MPRLLRGLLAWRLPIDERAGQRKIYIYATFPLKVRRFCEKTFVRKNKR
jgi:hypothetical protein